MNNIPPWPRRQNAKKHKIPENMCEAMWEVQMHIQIYPATGWLCNLSKSKACYLHLHRSYNPHNLTLTQCIQLNGKSASYRDTRVVSWICVLLAVWSWVDYLTSLVNSIICKMYSDSTYLEDSSKHYVIWHIKTITVPGTWWIFNKCQLWCW